MSYSAFKSSWFIYTIIFTLGILGLFLRNPESVLNPIVYAEDGVWTALGLREGWDHAFIGAREDYFVFLNVLLLMIASAIAVALAGGTLELLPYAIAFVSYSFFSLFSLLVFITVNKVSTKTFATLAWVLTLLIPLGDSQNEIIGRILQIGFYMPALAVMLLFWREQYPGSVRRYAIDVMLFFCAGTNPVVFILALFYFLYRLCVEKLDFIKVLKRNLFLVVLLLVLSIAIYPRLSGHGGIYQSFDMGNLLEAAIARPLLYPLIFPWYHKLSVALTLSLFVALSVFVFYALKVSANAQGKKLAYGLIITIVSYTALTILMRPGLTSILNTYQTSFPDRYFMGINVLVSILIVLCLAQLASYQKIRIYGVILASILVLIYCVHAALIFEWGKSKMPIGGFLTFKDQICLSNASSGLAGIEIYPASIGLKVKIPQKYIDKTKCMFRSYEEIGIAPPGATYQLVATDPLNVSKNITLNFYPHTIKNKKLDRIEIMLGTHMRSNPGSAKLDLEAAGGGSLQLEFPLSDLEDNRYKGFDLPDNVYISGKIIPFTGQGISAWESHDEDGDAFTCMNFYFSDGTRSRTPGCPD